MLVSHKYRFIFIKTRKSASTSVEMALSPFLTPSDIVTASNREQERQKKAQGFQQGVNFTKPFAAFGLHDWKEWLVDRYRNATGGYRALHASFYSCWPHMDGPSVRAHVGEDIWNSYYKFAVERDPWDKTLSLYFFRKYQGARGLKQGKVEQVDDEVKAEFLQWLKVQAAQPRSLSDAWYYCEDGGKGAFMLDHLIRYETLQEGLAQTAQKLGLPATPDVGRDKFNAHGGIRKTGHGMELYTPEAQAIMKELFAREFAILGSESSV